VVDGERAHPTSVASPSDRCPTRSPTAVDHREMPPPHGAARKGRATRRLA
jgi:hypothetical protein